MALRVIEFDLPNGDVAEIDWDKDYDPTPQDLEAIATELKKQISPAPQAATPPSEPTEKPGVAAPIPERIEGTFGELPPEQTNYETRAKKLIAPDVPATPPARDTSGLPSAVAQQEASIAGERRDVLPLLDSLKGPAYGEAEREAGRLLGPSAAAQLPLSERARLGMIEQKPGMYEKGSKLEKGLVKRSPAAQAAYAMGADVKTAQGIGATVEAGADLAKELVPDLAAGAALSMVPGGQGAGTIKLAATLARWVPRIAKLKDQAIVAKAAKNIISAAVQSAKITGGTAVAEAGKGAYKVASDQQTVEEALKQGAYTTAAVGAAILPSVTLPKTALQIIAQPLAGILVDMAAGRNVMEPEDRKAVVLNALLNAGFSLMDVKTGALWNGKENLKKWIKGKQIDVRPKDVTAYHPGLEGEGSATETSTTTEPTVASAEDEPYNLANSIRNFLHPDRLSAVNRKTEPAKEPASQPSSETAPDATPPATQQETGVNAPEVRSSVETPTATVPAPEGPAATVETTAKEEPDTFP
jgi:hypothetical protein